MRRIDARVAQGQFLRLLDEVAHGESFTFTRHGVDVATLERASVLGPRRTAVEAIAGLREFRRTHALGDVTLRDLIDDGVR